MNLFNKLFGKAKDAINKISRERTLKAEKNAYIANLEKDKAEWQTKIENYILNESNSFEDIINAYEEIEMIDTQIETADEAWDFIFTEEKEAV